jgi:flagellar biosynthesis protein FlhG
MVVLPIGSGKGGVGKSLLATNLSIALAESGRKVVLADLDLGASNAHTMLGLRGVSRGIGTFLSVPRTRFEDIVLPTEYTGLSFVPGDAEVPGVASLRAAQKNRLIRCLQALPADFLILDLGPGAGANPLDFFLLSPAGILVTTPGITSILNAYLFLKNVVFRLLYALADRESRAFAILEELRRDPGGLQRGYVPRIMERIAEEDPASHARLSTALGRMRPRLVLNMLDDPADADKGERLRRSVREYLGVDLQHLGVIFRDELQAIALGSRIPIVRYKPGSVLSSAIYRVAEKLARLPVSAETPWDWQLVDAPEVPEASAPGRSGRNAGAEAEADYQVLRRDVEDLLQSGALTQADLVEAVRSQLVELGELRRENALLRARIKRSGQDEA